MAMSFFNKLKNKLFKTSSKLEEGLAAIVEDGGVEEEETPVEASAVDLMPETAIFPDRKSVV